MNALPMTASGLLSFDSQRLGAPGEFDQLGSPVAAAERRVDPFQHQAPGPVRSAGRDCLHGFDPLEKSCDYGVSALRYAKCARYASDILKDIVKAGGL